MATIRLCDWTKQRLGKDEEVFEVSVQGGDGVPVVFEVSQAGRDMLFEQLQGDEELNAPKVQAVIPDKVIPDMNHQVHAQVTQTTEAIGNEAQPVTPLEIPDDIRKPLRKPPVAVAEQIVRESTIREEATMPTLTVGDKAQREARKRLEQLEQEQNNKLQRRTQSGVNLSTDNDYKPPR